MLLNNNHGANISIDTDKAVQTASLGVRDMKQMVYDATVALMGPSGKYLGVYNLTTIGVVHGDDMDAGTTDSASLDNRSTWTAEEVHARLKRRKMIDDEMRDHAHALAALMPPRAVADSTHLAGCGVQSADTAVVSLAALLQTWEGGEPPADCFPSTIRDFFAANPSAAGGWVPGSLPTSGDFARALRDDIDHEGYV